MAHGVFELVRVQICRGQHVPASAVRAILIDGNPYVEHRDEIVIVVAAVLGRRVHNCYLLQSHGGFIILIQAVPVRKADPNAGQGVYGNGHTVVDVVQNNGGIQP
jgi:hypothetical protein